MAPGPKPESGERGSDVRGYRRVTLGKSHPLANSGGWQYRHRIIAAQSLGRALKANEHVHHREADRGAETASSIDIVSAEMHGRYHASAIFFARDDRGRFVEKPVGGLVDWLRFGPVLGSQAAHGLY